MIDDFMRDNKSESFFFLWKVCEQFLKVENDLKFGIAYDVVLSKIQNNSLEFMLGYSFKVDYERPVKSYKNPRYL